MKKLLVVLISAILFLSFFLVSARGNSGDPIAYQSDYDIRIGGPFEASNSTARYALTESIVKDKSLFLSEDLAKFSSPDVAEQNNKFISLFTPGVSFIGIPFYWVGQQLGIPQFTTYLSSILFAFINIFLITIIVKKLGGNTLAGLLSGFIFAFATNAFPYSLTYTQHIFSVSVLLLALITSMGKRTILKNISFGLLFGAGVLLDFPNAFLMAPIGLYILAQHFSKEKINEKVKLNFKIIFFTVLLGIIPLAGLFAWYNKTTTGSPTLIAQSIGRTDKFSSSLPTHVSLENNKNEDKDDEEIRLFLSTREQLNSFYILLISNERAWVFFSPILFLGIWGLWIMHKDKAKKGFIAVCSAVILTNIVLYSMFGDPWGGWAFGPRYLIPAAAVLSIGISELIRRYNKNLFFGIIFIALLSYSIIISTVGAMTTNSIPPKVEAINLAYPIPYTFEYNFKLLEANNSSSLFYNLYLTELINAQLFVYTFSGILISTGIIIYILTLTEKGLPEYKDRSILYLPLPKSLKRKGEKNV